MSKANLGTAVITGASTGIGAIYADRLAGRGYDLVLVARNAERLQALAAELEAKHGGKVRTLAADLTRAADLYRVEEVLRTDASITVLVNNAGVGGGNSLLALDSARIEEMIALNVTALSRLSAAAAPGFVERGQGAFINIASALAIAPEVLNGVYGGTKAYVLAFSQSLRHELKDKGVRVQVVLPGATATDFWQTAGIPLQNVPKDWVMRADEMVDAALVGLDQGEFATIPALEDGAKWETFEAARQAMHAELSGNRSASRYGISAR